MGATVQYYQALAKAHEQRQKPLHLVMVHADMRRVLGYVQAEQLEDLTEYLAALVGQLKDGGADFAAISAVTPHICIRELAARSPLPLVDLLKVAREAIAGKRVALFGTRFTLESDLFGTLGEKRRSSTTGGTGANPRNIRANGCAGRRHGRRSASVNSPGAAADSARGSGVDCFCGDGSRSAFRPIQHPVSIHRFGAAAR